jgi:hypothetical protein
MQWGGRRESYVALPIMWSTRGMVAIGQGLRADEQNISRSPAQQMKGRDTTLSDTLDLIPTVRCGRSSLAQYRCASYVHGSTVRHNHFLTELGSVQLAGQAADDEMFIPYQKGVFFAHWDLG